MKKSFALVGLFFSFVFLVVFSPANVLAQSSGDCDPNQTVCSEFDYTYDSECLAQQEGVDYTLGPCETQDTSTEEECDPNQAVCSENDYTYESECLAQQEGVEYTIGVCEDNTTDDSSTSNCDSSQAVCSENNYTYESECLAQQEGVDYTIGACEEQETQECDPNQVVCSENDYTYESECLAQQEGVDYTMGACEADTTNYCVYYAQDGSVYKEDFNSESEAQVHMETLATDNIDATLEDTMCEDVAVNTSPDPDGGLYCVYTDIDQQEFSVENEALTYAEEMSGEMYEDACQDQKSGTKLCDTSQAVCSENNYTYQSECMAQLEGVDYTMGVCGAESEETSSAESDSQEQLGADNSCPLTPGKAYTHSDTSAVWLITEGGTKRPFQSSRVFNTHFDSFAAVNATSKENLDNCLDDNAGFVPYGPKYDPKGGALVKIPSDNRVYLLLGDQKYWITSETVFNELNYKWNWIEDVDPDLLDKYNTAGEIEDTSHHPVGTLVKYPDSNKVYRIEDGAFGNLVKRHIQDEQVFEALGYRFDRVVTIESDEEYETGDPISMSEI